MQTANSIATAGFDPGVFRKMMGKVPTSVSVVTSIDQTGGLAGMVVGTFTSVSLEPALVGFLPSKRKRGVDAALRVVAMMG